MSVAARIFLLLLPTLAFAQAPSTYDLMAPIGGMTSVDLTTYMQGIFQVTIGIAGILAVIMIVWCGLKMLGSPSVSDKSSAKECITNAIFGVLLAIGAWILLNTINTNLVGSSVAIPAVSPAPVTTPGGPPAGTYIWVVPGPIGTSPVPPIPGMIGSVVPPSWCPPPPPPGNICVSYTISPLPPTPPPGPLIPPLPPGPVVIPPFLPPPVAPPGPGTPPPPRSGPPGPPPAPWSGTCPGFAKTLIVDLPNTLKRLYTKDYGNFSPNDALVIRFTIPPSVTLGADAAFAAGEWIDPPTHRWAVLSTTPCDFTSGDTNGPLYNKVPGVQSVTYSLEVNLAGTPTFYQVLVVPGKTYYINIKNADVNNSPTCSTPTCNMYIDFLAPFSLVSPPPPPPPPAPPWSGTCPGFAKTIVLDIPWGAPGSLITYLTQDPPFNGFTGSTALVIRFTAPAGAPATSSYGHLRLAEYVDPLAQRTAVLSTNACDWTNTIGSPYYAQYSSTIDLSLRVGGAPVYAYHDLRMVAGTTYYLNVKNYNQFGSPSCSSGTCNVIINWQQPY